MRRTGRAPKTLGAGSSWWLHHQMPQSVICMLTANPPRCRVMDGTTRCWRRSRWWRSCNCSAPRATGRPEASMSLDRVRASICTTLPQQHSVEMFAPSRPQDIVTRSSPQSSCVSCNTGVHHDGWFLSSMKNTQSNSHLFRKPCGGMLLCTDADSAAAAAAAAVRGRSMQASGSASSAISSGARGGAEDSGRGWSSSRGAYCHRRLWSPCWSKAQMLCGVEPRILPVCWTGLLLPGA